MNSSIPTRPAPRRSNDDSKAWDDYFKSQSEANQWRDWA